MKKKKELKLIEGVFTPQDANEVLISLYSSKLNFHIKKNFSSNERFGKNDEIASKRIPELNESILVISSIIKDAADMKRNLIITATVTIQFAALKH